MSTKGYTLLELLITIFILAILAGFSDRLYTQYVVKTRRMDGQVALLKLASSLEDYYLQHHTYNGAGFATMDVKAYSPLNYYRLNIQLEADGQLYTLKAIPIGRQALADQACGTLTLTTDGRRQKAGCW